MKKYWWIVLIIVVAGVVALAFVLTHKKRTRYQSNSSAATEDTNSSKPEKLEYFPVRVEDFAVPPKMYGLWPYGIKGEDENSHNEGHPGWDFELKKGSKLYAVSDLQIAQIHEGDTSANGVALQVIEAYTSLSNGKYHIVYHSVTNIEPGVKEGATIKGGSVIAEAGYPLSDTSVMIHFGVFLPHDSVGACPTPYFADNLQDTIDQIVALSKDMKTDQPYSSACVGKISREIYEKNYPDRVQYFGGNEQWE